MSKTRESKKLITEQMSVTDAERYFADYADADAKLQKITAEMDIKITEIREKYSDKVAKLTETKDESYERLQHFALSNPAYFESKKSMELTHGKLGFRTGTPSLNKLKGFTWDAVTNMLKEFLPDYVRTKDEVNKEKLLADRDAAEISSLFTKCGVKVEQSEAFFVELKKEEAIAV